MFAGCSTPLKKTQRYLFEHPDFSSGYCAEQFPVKDSVLVKYDTVLDLGNWEFQYSDSNGNSLYLTDSGYVLHIDSTKWVKYNLEPKVITKTKTVYKTIRKDSIIVRRDYAKEKELQLSLSACQVNNNALLENYNEQTQLVATWQGKAKKRWWLIFALIGGAVVYTGLKIKKFLV